jgi:hypothetical protein
MKKIKERYLVIVDAEKLFDEKFFDKLGVSKNYKEVCCKIAISVSNNLLQVEKSLNEMCKNNFIDFVCMVDTKKDVCYIYKAKGSLNEIKKEILPKLEIPFKFVTKNEMVFKKIEDLRILMKLSGKGTYLN